MNFYIQGTSVIADDEVKTTEMATFMKNKGYLKMTNSLKITFMR